MGQEAAKILIVDDDDDIRELLFDRLAFMGHEVLTARNGREGLHRIEADEPDLVMLDIQMPELDGFGVLSGVAEKELNTTIIMITANGTIQKAVQAMQEGAFDFLLKPFQPRDVERRVDRALTQVRLARENERLQAELAQAKEKLIGEMQRELQAAHDMQMQLLPDRAPQLPGWDMAGTCIPSRQVGGDYYTFVEGMGKEQDRWGVVVADVSGKGMQAATVAMRFNEMLRYEILGKVSNVDILTGLDRALRGRIPPEMFVTCGIAELDVTKKIMRFATAACPEVYHFVAKDQQVVPLGMAGLPLGIALMLNGTMYEDVEIQLHAGDMVVFTSDGVEEARNESDDFYGPERLQELIARCGVAGKNAHDVRDAIVNDVSKFVEDAPQTDDLTVVVVQVGA
jgi:phosphoserine phosphatase RsbU/P